MDKKLAEYRAKKYRTEKIESIKSKLSNFFSSEKKIDDKANEDEQQTKEVLIREEPLEEAVIENYNNRWGVFDIIYYSLWFTLWVFLYLVFIEMQFGTVYLIMSGLLGIYLNTRTGPKRANEVSAYSVFNKNCESIDGTLKAEQFESEIRFGAGSVR